MIQSISLKKLVPSPRNVRKTSDPAADEQLKTDIAARGLLQNLVVRKAKRGKFEVEAGGRRLAALQALAVTLLRGGHQSFGAAYQKSFFFF